MSLLVKGKLLQKLLRKVEKDLFFSVLFKQFNLDLLQNQFDLTEVLVSNLRQLELVGVDIEVL